MMDLEPFANVTLSRLLDENMCTIIVVVVVGYTCMYIIDNIRH